MGFIEPFERDARLPGGFRRGTVVFESRTYTDFRRLRISRAKTLVMISWFFFFGRHITPPHEQSASVKILVRVRRPLPDEPVSQQLEKLDRVVFQHGRTAFRSTGHRDHFRSVFLVDRLVVQVRDQQTAEIRHPKIY